MTEVDAIIDGGYHHALEEEKRIIGLSHYILNHIDQLPQSTILRLAKKGLQSDLKVMTIEEVEREFMGLQNHLKSLEVSQNENNVSTEK